MERYTTGRLICFNVGPGAGGLNTGPGSGSINVGPRPGAGDLNTGPGSGSIDAGSIDRGVPFLAQLGLHRMTKEEIRKYLLKWDKNGDGFLSKQEIKRALGSLGSFFPGYRAQKAISVADMDGDGRVNMNNDEFEVLIDYVYNLGIIDLVL